MKKCTMCKEVKSRSKFNKDSRAKDNRHCYCKSCRQKLRDDLRGLKQLKQLIHKVTSKECSKCGLILPAENFNTDSRAKSGLRSDCKNCRKLNEIDSRRLETISEKHKLCMNSVYLNYKLSESQLQHMLLQQQGVCEICETDFGLLNSGKYRSYCIDHDHKTNKVRGLLCFRCNRNVSLAERKIISSSIYEQYLNKYTDSVS